MDELIRAKSIKVLLISYCHFSDISELLATFISPAMFGETSQSTVFVFGPNKPVTDTIQFPSLPPAKMYCGAVCPTLVTGN